MLPTRWWSSFVPHAAEALEVASRDVEYAGGGFRVPARICASRLPRCGARVPESAASDCSAEADFEGNVVTIPNGAYVCEVEVDPDTGQVSLLRFVGVDDVGRRINPVIVDGQLHGGIAHGLGQAWMEHVRYDAASGQAVTGSLMDYAAPRADHFPLLRAARLGCPYRKQSHRRQGCRRTRLPRCSGCLHERRGRRHRDPGDRYARHPGAGLAGPPAMTPSRAPVQR